MLSSDELYQISDTLATGFQTLLDEFEAQHRVESDLKVQLERSGKQYTQGSSKSSSDQISDWQDEIVKQITTYPTPATSIKPQSNEIIERAKVAVAHLKSNMPAINNTTRKCPVSHKVTDQEDFEHDFTTPGRPGNLGCPFAKIVPGGASRNSLSPDPIAAEFHADQASIQTPGSARAGNKCPIRFLDKHSPEEVAQYFENHKHEIPRSHEICVKRYQTNENSIRQLDAKYGSLVSMIQGLGTKHKQYLTEDQQDEHDDPGIEQNSTRAVEKWAQDVDENSGLVNDESEQRRSHFEKPLRDIRVGESPTRPWGISVPVERLPITSATPSVNQITASHKPISTTPAPIAVEACQAQDVTPSKTRSDDKKPTQIIFNGPVFFGYTPEQAALFLQNLNLGSTN